MSIISSYSTVDEQTPFTTKVAPKIEPTKETPKTRKDVISKRSGVTKIGNNTYYYTGKLNSVTTTNGRFHRLI